jgi:hypothetical protein
VSEKTDCKACRHRTSKGLEGQCPACAHDRVRAELAAERAAKLRRECSWDCLCEDCIGASPRQRMQRRENEK